MTDATNCSDAASALTIQRNSFGVSTKASIGSDKGGCLVLGLGVLACTQPSSPRLSSTQRAVGELYRHHQGDPSARVDALGARLIFRDGDGTKPSVVRLAQEIKAGGYTYMVRSEHGHTGHWQIAAHPADGGDAVQLGRFTVPGRSDRRLPRDMQNSSASEIAEHIDEIVKVEGGIGGMVNHYKRNERISIYEVLAAGPRWRHGRETGELTEAIGFAQGAPTPITVEVGASESRLASVYWGVRQPLARGALPGKRDLEMVMMQPAAGTIIRAYLEQIAQRIGDQVGKQQRHEWPTKIILSNLVWPKNQYFEVELARNAPVAGIPASATYTGRYDAIGDRISSFEMKNTEERHSASFLGLERSASEELRLE